MVPDVREINPELRKAVYMIAMGVLFFLAAYKVIDADSARQYGEALGYILLGGVNGLASRHVPTPIWEEDE